MLAIMRALKEWRHYLEGATHRFEILTDHANLKYFMEAKKLNRRQARWALELSNFEFLLTHRAGAQPQKVDLLSRRLDHERGVEDNKDQILLKPEFFAVRALRQGHVLIKAEEANVLKEIRNKKSSEEPIAQAIENLKRSPNKTLHTDEWTDKQGLFMFRGKVYVPNNVELRRKIVSLHHDSTIAGHPGRWKTMELITRNYWWPGMTKFIIEYIKGCDTCNRTKVIPVKPIGRLMPNLIPERPWEHVTADMVIGLRKLYSPPRILVDSI